MALSNVRVWSLAESYTLPSGGTWYYYCAPVGVSDARTGSVAGGSKITSDVKTNDGEKFYGGGIAIRVS